MEQAMETAMTALCACLSISVRLSGRGWSFHRSMLKAEKIRSIKPREIMASPP
jgi:hypothetical protein